MDAATFVGSIGVALLLIAFLLNVLKLMSADGYAYAVLNFVGAAAFALGRASYFAAPWLSGLEPGVGC